MEPVSSAYLVPTDHSFSVTDAPTAPPIDAPDKDTYKAQLKENVAAISELQRMLYAHDQFSLLLVFQAMDAAGKDGTIRKVLSGVNPAECKVYSYKAPSKEELDHDFLWHDVRLPELRSYQRVNRSYYEEVLVVRVLSSIYGAKSSPIPVGLSGRAF